MVKNGQKWPKIQFSGKGPENGAVTACFNWQKCYHWVLLQWNLQKESYFRLLPPHFPAISLKIQFLAIFGHFSPFVPAHGRPLDPTSAFIDITIITECSCNDMCIEKAAPGYYHPIFLPLAWKLNFWSFLAIFHHLCLLMGDPMTPYLLLLTKMLSLILIIWPQP